MADFLEWDKSYLVGDKDADAEHQKILQLVNMFLTSLSEAKATKILDAILDQIIEVAREHFKKEEALIKKGADTPTFIQTKEDHQNRIKELRMLRGSYARANLGVDDVLPFFKDWIFEHIEKSGKGLSFQTNSPG